jgi:drug/metabolite transporter (DMT)-like permease
MTRNHGTALGAGAITAWSCYGVLLASNSVTAPFRSMAIVFTCATLVLLARRLIQGKGIADILHIPLPTLALGVLGLFGSNCLYVVALALGGDPVPVNIAALAWPVFLVIVVAVSGVARATWYDAVAMLIGFGGIVLLSLPKGGLAFDWPVLVALAGALCWALYSGLRNKVPAGPQDSMIGFVGISAILCWIITLTTETSSVPLAEFLRLAAVGIIPVGLANLAWDLGARHGDPVLLAGFSFLEPIASTALIAIVLSLPIGYTEVGALALVICAVGFSLMSERQRRRQLRPQPGIGM